MFSHSPNISLYLHSIEKTLLLKSLEPARDTYIHVMKIIKQNKLKNTIKHFHMQASDDNMGETTTTVCN